MGRMADQAEARADPVDRVARDVDLDTGRVVPAGQPLADLVARRRDRNQKAISNR